MLAPALECVDTCHTVNWHLCRRETERSPYASPIVPLSSGSVSEVSSVPVSFSGRTLVSTLSIDVSPGARSPRYRTENIVGYLGWHMQATRLIRDIKIYGITVNEYAPYPRFGICRSNAR